MWNQTLLRRWEKGWFQEGRIKMKRTFCKSLFHRILSYMLGQQQRPTKDNYTRSSFCESKQSFKRGVLGGFLLLLLFLYLFFSCKLILIDLRKIWIFFLSRFLISCCAECITSCLLGWCYRGRDWEVHSFPYPLVFLGFPRWNFSFTHQVLILHNIIPKRTVLTRKWGLSHMPPSCPSLLYFFSTWILYFKALFLCLPLLFSPWTTQSLILPYSQLAKEHPMHKYSRNTHMDQVNISECSG